MSAVGPKLGHQANLFELETGQGQGMGLAQNATEAIRTRTGGEAWSNCRFQHRKP